MQNARPEISIDNDTVRVTTWTLAPGVSTGPHRHELDYVVVPMTDGRLTMTAAGHISTSVLVRGDSYFREAGVEHEVSNPGAEPVVFVEVEVKSPTST